MLALLAISLLIPLKRGMLNVAATFVCFYCVAAPVAGVLALTDAATTSVPVKMAACVGATTIAQAPLALFGFVWCVRLDWRAAGKIVAMRANMDKASVDPAAPLAVAAEPVREQSSPLPSDSAQSPGFTRQRSPLVPGLARQRSPAMTLP